MNTEYEHKALSVSEYVSTDEHKWVIISALILKFPWHICVTISVQAHLLLKVWTVLAA